MAGDTLVCDQHVSSETLSAWRDALLSPAEMDRIRSHAAQCAACQARLAAFEAVALALRNQREIEPDGRLLANVRARAAQSPRRAHLHLRNRRVWGGLGALGSVAALLLLFLYLLGAGPGRPTGPLAGKTPSASTTATVSPTAVPLVWHQLSAPPSGAGGFPMDVSPAIGDTFYACDLDSVRSAGSITVWISHDRTTHWQRTTPIPARAPLTLCWLHVDTLSPATAVIEVSNTPNGAGPELNTFTSYVTTDYGQHWRTLTFPQPTIIVQLATRGASTYAILRGYSSDELAVSNDAMRTWQRIDRGISTGANATSFWLNPVSGALLVWWSDLWSSDDGGVHWTRLPIPPSPSNASMNVLVRQPVASGPWQICIVIDDSLNRSDTQPNKLSCSTNGGATWETRPGLNVSFTNPGKGTFIASTDAFAIANDGAVLATELGMNDETLYRLSADGQHWQSLGQVPNSPGLFAYMPTPANGYVLCLQTLVAAEYTP